MFNLARKNHLAIHLNRLRKVFPENYKFFPKTWILPADMGDLSKQFEKGKLKTFILKPQASCQGRGIMLVQNVDQIPAGEAFVAQRYVLKPYLIDDYKFDLRIYFLVAGTDPLRLFVYKEGMARLATSNYTAPGRDNINNMFMHLTNYAINKFNKDFEQNEGEDPGKGHKRLMSWVFQMMKEKGCDTDKLWTEIKKIALKTLCAAQPQLAHHYRSSQSEDYYNHMCFEVLGFDILIDQQCRPILLEVNHTPSFATDSKLDHDLKSSVIRDAIILMNITQEMKVKLINMKKKEQEQRVLTGIRKKLTQEERDKIKMKCQEERDEYIKANLGQWDPIYPFASKADETEPYEEFMKVANEQFEIKTGACKKPIKKEEAKKPSFGSKFTQEPQKMNRGPAKPVPTRTVEAQAPTIGAKKVPMRAWRDGQIDKSSAIPPFEAFVQANREAGKPMTPTTQTRVKSIQQESQSHTDSRHETAKSELLARIEGVSSEGLTPKTTDHSYGYVAMKRYRNRVDKSATQDSPAPPTSHQSKPHHPMTMQVIPTNSEAENKSRPQSNTNSNRLATNKMGSMEKLAGHQVVKDGKNTDSGKIRSELTVGSNIERVSFATVSNNYTAGSGSRPPRNDTKDKALKSPTVNQGREPYRVVREKRLTQVPTPGLQHSIVRKEPNQ
jgi:hypothetical protein